MKPIDSRQFALCAAAAIVTAALTWHFARSGFERIEADDTLQRVVALLDENARLIDSLKRVEGIESDAAILSSYLALIRKDSVPKHSDLKQNIDRWMNNNTAIVILLNRYTVRNGSAAFRVATTQYSEYATTLRDRWQSVFEIFMAGGNLPAANGSPPAGFKEALRSELAAH